TSYRTTVPAAEGARNQRAPCQNDRVERRSNLPIFRTIQPRQGTWNFVATVRFDRTSTPLVEQSSSSGIPGGKRQNRLTKTSNQAKQHTAHYYSRTGIPTRCVRSENTQYL
ncbi:unnamed protein product, partial [Ectocarpus fasciculatus]